MPSHYLNQCWIIVNWTLRNKLQLNFNWNSYIFIQENALDKVVCKMAAILSQPQWVNLTKSASYLVSVSKHGVSVVSTLEKIAHNSEKIARISDPPPVTNRFLSPRRAVMRKAFPCVDVIMMILMFLITNCSNSAGDELLWLIRSVN